MTACDGGRAKGTSGTEDAAAVVQRKTEARVCVDRVLPTAKYEDGKAAALAENAKNKYVEQGASATVQYHKKWRPGRTLHVRFLGGQPDIIEHVKSAAGEWTKSVDINFVFDDAPSAEIRVAFLEGQGSWSLIGTDALHADVTAPTMNYGWFDSETRDEEYTRVVLHEFGHALGLLHEHQNPSNGVKWNREAVYAYYAREPNKWDRATTDLNIFQKYSKTATQYTAFDSASIMLYPIPADQTLDGFSVGWNKTLSPTDKCYMGGLVYPKTGVQSCAK